MNKPTLNKWEYTLEQADWSPTHHSVEGWKHVTFGIYKFLQYPDQGETYSKKDYKGFIIKFSYWLPIRLNK